MIYIFYCIEIRMKVARIYFSNLGNKFLKDTLLTIYQLK